MPERAVLRVTGTASRTGGVVLCRMDSTRLPGKVLRDVHGRPLLWYILRRCLEAASLEGRLVVATSGRAVDDPIVRHCEREGIAVFRGDADDVAGRFLAAARALNLDAAARINADSPLLDPGLIDQAAGILAQDGVDFVTNLQPRSFPYGVAVELFRTDVFAEGYARMRTAVDKEHVTRFFYEHSAEYRYVNIGRQLADGRLDDRSSCSLVVDEDAHLQSFCKFVHTVGAPWQRVSYMDAVAFGGFA